MKIELNFGRRSLFAILMIAIAVGTYFGVIKWQRNRTNQQAEAQKTIWKLVDYENEDDGLKIKYPDTFVTGKIAEESKKKEGILFKLVRTNPPTLITVWQETGLGMVEAYVKQPLLEYLKGNVERSYKVNFNDYKQEKIEDDKLAGSDAFTVWFTFQDKQKDYREKIKQSVAVKDKTAYYFQCMAPENVWYQAEPGCNIARDNLELLSK